VARMRALVLCLVLCSTPALAARVTVPVDVGFGPSALLITGPVFDDQPIHYGLKINVEAVIDQAWIRKNQRVVPKKYRGAAKNVKEMRISPSIFIPDHFFISPKLQNTGIYGVTWRPIGLVHSMGEGAARLRLGAGLLATYAFLHSDVLPTTHFVRPGLDLMAQFELMATKNFGVSLGWASGFYVPQKLGSLELAPLNESMWHVGQAFFKFHIRFPYTVNL
jgi:hypothetical protein